MGGLDMSTGGSGIGKIGTGAAMIGATSPVVMKNAIGAGKTLARVATPALESAGSAPLKGAIAQSALQALKDKYSQRNLP